MQFSSIPSGTITRMHDPNINYYSYLYIMIIIIHNVMHISIVLERCFQYSFQSFFQAWRTGLYLQQRHVARCLTLAWHIRLTTIKLSLRSLISSNFVVNITFLTVWDPMIRVFHLRPLNRLYLEFVFKDEPLALTLNKNSIKCEIHIYRVDESTTCKKLIETTRM